MTRITAWLHQTLWLAYTLLAMMCIGFVFLLLDRDPPFRVMPLGPSIVQAGEWALIDVPVWRDPKRRCSVTFSRYLFDSERSRFDLGGQQIATAQMISRLERETPGRLLIKVQMPPAKDSYHEDGVALGPASLITNLKYVCNRAQQLAPIEVETEIPLVIVP